MSIKNDGHYFCRAGGNRPDGLNEPVTLSQFDQLLKKLSVEAAFNAEMAHHLGYEKNQPRITGTDNCKYPA
ncbi:hypothetical protein HVZ34_00765 [Escherichia coli]|nr:hypothetical protein [Escherichia coli]